MQAANKRPSWEIEGQNWPNRDTSFFHRSGGLNWHVQESGEDNEQTILLLHGTGSASHSFRDLAPLLATDFHVVTLDLPGHGFTSNFGPTDLSLAGMAQSISGLLKSLDLEPSAILGHSAGAAIGIRMALGEANIKHVFGVNAALKPIKGNSILSPMAKLLFANQVSSKLFSITASQSSIGRNLIASAGPEIDQQGHDTYAMLMKYPEHVRGALGMMASWDLNSLVQELPGLKAKLTLITAKDDKLVPPTDSQNAIKIRPETESIEFEKGGHLLHEVNSIKIADIVKIRLLNTSSGETQ